LQFLDKQTELLDLNLSQVNESDAKTKRRRAMGYFPRQIEPFACQ
jgi:hypothetical protein